MTDIDLRCPLCGKGFRLQDLGRHEVFFECDTCHLELERVSLRALELERDRASLADTNAVDVARPIGSDVVLAESGRLFAPWKNGCLLAFLAGGATFLGADTALALAAPRRSVVVVVVLAAMLMLVVVPIGAFVLGYRRQDSENRRLRLLQTHERARTSPYGDPATETNPHRATYG